MWGEVIDALGKKILRRTDQDFKFPRTFFTIILNSI
jgi:hypothetical protein